MSGRVIKNYQISVGTPLKVNVEDVNKKNTNDDVHNINEDSLKKLSKIQVDKFIEEAKIKAEGLLDQAHKEVETILNTANQEAVKLKNEAKQEATQIGYQEGFNKGYEDSKNKHLYLIEEVEDLKQDTIKECKKYMESIESEIIKMVMEISKKVINDKITNDKDEILEMVKQSIEKCCNNEQITVRVSYQDYDYIYENRDKLISSIEGLEKLEIVKEESLELGSCIIESSYGIIDSSVNKKLKRVEDSFYNIIAGNKEN